jgi:hypothetical protein
MPVKGVDDSAADILHVSGAAPQVGIIHSLEGVHIELDDFMHRSGRTVILIDKVFYLGDETAILQYHQMRVED